MNDSKENHHQRYYLLLMLLVLPFLLSTWQAPAKDGTDVSSELREILEPIAEAAILTQNETLVTGDLISVLRNKRHPGRYCKSLAHQLESQLRIRSKLKEKNIHYKSFETRFLPRDMWSEAGKVAFVLTEETKVYLAAPTAMGPEVSEYQQDYLFWFAYAGGDWSVIKVSEVPIGYPTPTREDHELEKPSPNLVPAVPPAEPLNWGQLCDSP